MKQRWLAVGNTVSDLNIYRSTDECYPSPVAALEAALTYGLPNSTSEAAADRRILDQTQRNSCTTYFLFHGAIHVTGPSGAG